MNEVFPPEKTGSEEAEPKLTERIAGVGNFDELYEVLRGVDEVKGSQKTYSYATLFERIEAIRSIHRDKGGDPMKTMPDIMMRVTNTGGLRDKVIELLEDDEISTAKIQIDSPK